MDPYNLTYRSTPRRGLALIEVLAILACIAVLLTLVFYLGKSTICGGTIKCKTKVKAIHFGWSAWAQSHQGKFPIPTEVSPDTAAMSVQTGNSTANIHSLLIYNNYYSPEIAVCPVEHSYVISEYNAYDYKTNAAWDPNFSCDISATSTIDTRTKNYSNVSYANLAIIGKRMRHEWAVSLNSNFAVLSDRGPKNGIYIANAAPFLNHGSNNDWVGNVVYNDGHVDTLTTSADSRTPFTPDNIVWHEPANGQPADFLGTNKGTSNPDNIFCEDDTITRSDIWLAVFGNSDDISVTPLWDP